MGDDQDRREAYNKADRARAEARECYEHRRRLLRELAEAVRPNVCALRAVLDDLAAAERKAEAADAECVKAGVGVYHPLTMPDLGDLFDPYHAAGVRRGS